ncbi:MAG: hypothetical protein ACXWEI_17630, partial [Mycobacterium sp.]
IRSRAGSPDTGVVGLVASHGDGVAVVAFAAAVLVVFFAGLSIGAVVVAALLAMTGLWAMRASPPTGAAQR